MFYLNQLIKHRMTELSVIQAGLDTETLISFGDRKLFIGHWFHRSKLSYGLLEEMREKSPGDVPSDWQNSWREYIGQGLRHIVETVEITSEGKRLCFSSNNETLFENTDFTSAETVHVYASSLRVSDNDGLPVAKVIVDESLNSMVQAYKSVSVRADCLREIIELRPEERAIFVRFMSDSRYGNSIFNAIAYLAACALTREESLQEGAAIRDALENYNQSVQVEDKVEPEEILCLLEIQDTKDIIRVWEGMPRARVCAINPLVEYLFVCSSVQNEADVITKLLSKERYLPGVADTLGKICSESHLSDLVNELLLRMTTTGNDSAAADLLFELVASNHELEKDTLHRILDALFSDCLTGSHLRKMTRLLKSPNFLELSHYITNKLNSDKPRFVEFWAAIWVHHTVERGGDPMWLSEEIMLASPSSQGALVAMAAISIGASASREGVAFPLRPRNFTGLVRVLYNHLTDPKKVFYRYAVNLVKNFVLSEVVDQKLLMKKRIFEAAVTALKDSETREYAETVLSLLPDSIQVEDEIRCQYLGHLEQAYQEKDPPAAMKHFRLAKALGAWQGRAALLKEFTRLVDCLHAYEGFDSESLDPDVYGFLKLTCQELCHKYQDCFTRTSAEALLPLTIGVSDSYFEQYRDAWKTLRDDPSAEFLMKNELRMAYFLAAVRVVENLEEKAYAEKTAILKDLAARSRIEEFHISSFLATNWLKYVLVRFDLAKQAVDFYEKHKALLDRPCRFYSTKLYHGLEGFYASDLFRFLHGESRLADALKFAEQVGSKNVLRAFRFLPEGEDTEPVDTMLARSRIRSELASDLPRDDYMGISLYYDDLGMVSDVLQLVPNVEKRNALYTLGYSAVLED